MRDIALHDCVQFNKPVKLRELTQAIEKLLAEPPDSLVVRPLRTAYALSVSGASRIIVVDDDDQVREAIRAVLEDDGRVVETYASCEAFLDGFHSDKSACLLIDAYLPGMSGQHPSADARHCGGHPGKAGGTPRILDRAGGAIETQRHEGFVAMVVRNLANAGSDFDPVLFMMEARWFLDCALADADETLELRSCRLADCSRQGQRSGRNVPRANNSRAAAPSMAVEIL